MRIEPSCNPVKNSHPILADIPVGTVFRFGAHEFGPYLRTAKGYLDLHTAEYREMPSEIKLFCYKALPHARLVTGEDA